MERTLYFGSVSSASRGKRLLAAARIRAHLIKLESDEEGCAWGLRLREEELLRAAQVLRAEGVRYEVR
ncbi:MAG: hypothetical protein IJV96_06670 [Clostridia bacterium]|nr:hypothetical protein [Clostridia bacterium]